MFANVDDAVLRHERVKLLLVVRHTGRKWRDVPVHMSIALLAAVEGEVLPVGEVMHPVFDMPLRRDQAVSDEGWKAVQERDCLRVLIHDLMGVVVGPRHDPADEAVTFRSAPPNALGITGHVDRLPCRWQRLHRRLIVGVHLDVARLIDRLADARWGQTSHI